MVKIKRVNVNKPISARINNTRGRRGVKRMGVAMVKSNKMSPIGESIESIRNIANKYMKTIEDEKLAEEKLRTELRKQGYTRF
jgi:hypothetical protein